MRMRKKRNGEKRIANLAKLLLTSEDISSENPTFSFETPRPIRLEIGCGKGDFVCGISEREKEYNYIALERVSDVMMAAVEKYAASRGLGSLSAYGGWMTPDGEIYDGETWDIPEAMRGNVRFVCGDARDILALLPDGSVDRIYTNFSDPWPKKGYASRRLTAPGFLAEYARVLRRGGELRLKTDNDGFFDYSLETLADSPLRVTEFTRDIDSSPVFSAGNVETEYERNFKSQGVKIKALIAINE